MTQITIQTDQPGLAWRYGGTAATLRVYVNQTIITSTGTTLLQGSYKEVPCTVSGTVITIPSFTLDSTTDSNNLYATYTAIFYDYRNVKRNTLLAEFRLDYDTMGASVSWETIRDYITAPQVTFFNYEAIITLIERYFSRALPIVNAARLILGKTALSEDPVSAAFPIAVGENDKVWTATKQTKYLDSYGSTQAGLNAALADIGSVTATELKITNALTVSATTSIPANILVKFEGNGLATISSGQTLTIGRMADVGNRQVFSGTGTVRFSAGAVEAMNLYWWTGASATAGTNRTTNAINQIIASATANGGGVMYVPQGTWTTAGDHAVCNNLIIKGDGLTTTVLKATQNGDGVFTHGANVYDVLLRDLTIDGDGYVIAGYRCAADYGDGSAGKLRFESVKLFNCEYGFQIEDTLSNEWQMAAVSFDAKCWVSGNTYGVWCNTLNNVVECDAFFEVGANQWAGYITGSGQWRLTGEFAGSTYNGENQVVTQTIVAAAGITSNGIATATVTAAGMPNSPKVISVPVDTAMTTATLIADAFREALGNDPDYTTFFHIAGTGADLQCIALDPAANDLTMNLAISTGTAGGITNNATATKTTNGVADTAQARGFYFDNAHGTWNFIGTQDEGFQDFIVSDTSDYNSQINFFGALIQAPLRFNGNCTVNTTNCNITDRSIRDALNANVLYTSTGDLVVSQSSFAGSPFRTLSARRTHNFSGDVLIGSGQVLAETIPSEMRSVTQAAQRIYHNDTQFFEPRERGRVEAMSSVDPSGGDDWTLLKLGRCTATGEPLFYYDFTRHYSNGRLTLAGNQTSVAGAVGLDFNGDITAVNFRASERTPTQITSDQNNWNPGSSAQNILAATDASRTVTGMTFDYAQNGGDVRVIWNTGSFNLVLANQSASSTAGNRFLNVTGADLTLLPNQGALCFYDGTARRWRTFPMSAFQPLDADLTAIAALTSAADKGIQFTGAGTAATYDLTAAGKALLDDANAAAQLVTLGLNATATEINQLNDVSAYQETVTAAGALSVTKVYSKIALVGAGAVTLAVPDASMLGQVKTLEMTVDNGDVTLSLANCEGQSSGTTATFNDVGDKLILVAGTSKWTIIKEFGVTLS